jgi:hypothetical protein
MIRAPFDDVQQPLPLSVGEVAGQFDVTINVIEPSAAGFALDTAINVNVQVLQHYSNWLEWPPLACGLHLHRHGGICPVLGR